MFSISQVFIGLNGHASLQDISDSRCKWTFLSIFSVENVEDLLLLSHEYQVKQHIFDPCVKFLEDQTKTKQNVMKIVALANLYNLEKVHQGCIDLLKNMRLESLSETVHLEDLDKEQTQYYLTQRIERLETVLDEAFPQFFGVVATVVLLIYQAKGQYLEWCREHVSGGKFKTSISFEMMAKCSDCRSMLSSMVNATMENQFLYSINKSVTKPFHGSKNHFDDDLFSVMENFVKLTGKS